MMQKNRQIAEPVPEVVPLLAPVDTAPSPVRLIAGADVQDLPLAGRRVGEARTVARNMFGIAPAALALVDGTVGVVVAPHGRLTLAMRFEIRDARIAAIDVVAEPGRLRGLEVALLD